MEKVYFFNLIKKKDYNFKPKVADLLGCCSKKMNRIFEIFIPLFSTPGRGYFN